MQVSAGEGYISELGRRKPPLKPFPERAIRAGIRWFGPLRGVTGGATLAKILRGNQVTTRRSVLIRSAAALTALSLPRRAFAQAYPTKPIKIIVPFPPGGPADTAVRIVQPGIEKALGQPIVVENVAGAAGGIGAQRVKQAEPDGYTLLQAASPHTTNAAVKPEANVDLLRDFAPIGQTGDSVYTVSYTHLTLPTILRV